VFERHGGFPDNECDLPAPMGRRPPNAARVHAPPSRRAKRKTARTVSAMVIARAE
jgi:hypothetical protein